MALFVVALFAVTNLILLLCLQTLSLTNGLLFVQFCQKPEENTRYWYACMGPWDITNRHKLGLVAECLKFDHVTARGPLNKGHK